MSVNLTVFYSMRPIKRGLFTNKIQLQKYDDRRNLDCFNYYYLPVDQEVSTHQGLFHINLYVSPKINDDYSLKASRIIQNIQKL